MATIPAGCAGSIATRPHNASHASSQQAQRPTPQGQCQATTAVRDELQQARLKRACEVIDDFDRVVKRARLRAQEDIERILLSDVSRPRQPAVPPVPSSMNPSDIAPPADRRTRVEAERIEHATHARSAITVVSGTVSGFDVGAASTHVSRPANITNCRLTSGSLSAPSRGIQRSDRTISTRQSNVTRPFIPGAPTHRITDTVHGAAHTTSEASALSLPTAQSCQPSVAVAPAVVPLQAFHDRAFEPFRASMHTRHGHTAYLEWDQTDPLDAFDETRKAEFYDWFRRQEGLGSVICGVVVRQSQQRAALWLRKVIEAKARESLRRAEQREAAQQRSWHQEQRGQPRPSATTASATPLQYMGRAAASYITTEGHPIVCCICMDEEMLTTRRVLPCHDSHVVCDDCMEDFKTKTARPAGLWPGCVPCPVCKAVVRFS